MSELDELERELLEAADTWFSQRLHGKLQRLIAIARENKSTSAPDYQAGSAAGYRPKNNEAHAPVDESDA